MSDFRFNDIVDSSVVTSEGNTYVKSICKACSKQRKVERDEFELDTIYDLDGSKFIPDSVDIDMLRYVAEMRAWNCCHQNDVPIDGFPEKVNSNVIEFDK